ncbi:MAG: DUF2066 domain-containing protein [Parvibaculaceae bacterium]
MQFFPRQGAGFARFVLAALLVGCLCTLSTGLRAADSAIYTVTGVTVDTTDKDAALAKQKAVSEAIAKAFGILAERLGGLGAAERFKRMKPADIGRMLSSLSIEEERTGPGRYIGKLTVRFLPSRIRETMSQAGINYIEERAPPLVVLPVWKDPSGILVWQDSVWRKAWLSLNAENSLVPVIVPLGDLADTETISPEEALQGDKLKLEALRMRYSAEAVLVAIAEPSGDKAVRAVMTGDSPLGRFGFDKIYEAEQGGVEEAASLAAKRFHAAMVTKWVKSREQAAPQFAIQVLSVAVPFSDLDQWNTLRSIILATPGIAAVDISSIVAGGAFVQLKYGVPFEELRSALAGNRLSLAMEGNMWVLREL